MPLAHLRLPGLTPYLHASALQAQLVQRLLAHKDAAKPTPPPPPTIITAEFHPVYTCGRREIGAVSAAQAAHLRAHGAAEFQPALRGGQTTFHGPGQLVAYPLLGLKRHGLSARSYVHALEQGVINTCARYGVRGFRTENPGVWTSDDEKICAVGVHLRRHVASHGIGLNVGTDLGWFERIVACGLEGKQATSLVRQGVVGVNVNDVAYTYVDEMRKILGIDEAITVAEGDMLAADEGAYA